MSIFYKKKQTHRFRKQTYGYTGEGGGTVREHRIDVLVQLVQSLSRVQLLATQ